MTKRLFVPALVVLFGTRMLLWAGSSILQIEAAKLFDASVTHHLRLSKEPVEIELETGELFEDDGPASGHSYQKPENRETLSDQTWIKKELFIGNLEATSIGTPISETGPVKVVVAGEPGSSGRTEVEARTGTTYVPDAKHWSEWQILGENGGTVARLFGRYLQFKVALSSTDSRQTPTLKDVRIEASPVCPGDWTARLKVLEEHNEQIVRTSIPFEYERLDHPHLKQLRHLGCFEFIWIRRRPASKHSWPRSTAPQQTAFPQGSPGHCTRARTACV